MVGGGASGKTTTRKAFVAGEPEEHKDTRDVPTVKGVRPIPITWTFYDNCALVGNHNSGTDTVNGPGAVKEAFYECLKEYDTVVVDGKITSPQWVHMCNSWQEEHPEDVLEIFLVYFKLTGEELLRRLAGRRGETPEEVLEKTRQDVFQGERRASLLMEQFDAMCKLPIIDLEVDKHMCTTDIVWEIDEYVLEHFQEQDKELGIERYETSYG